MHIRQLFDPFSGKACLKHTRFKITAKNASTSLRSQNTACYSSGTQAHLRDDRARLSNIWVPTGGITANSFEDAHAKLVRAGFLRQAHSGIFHMLPLGRRVQVKVEALIDKHMQELGASRLELSSISSEEIWTRSGRLAAVSSELFRFQDRKKIKYLLSPTHEEEITTLVATVVKSYKQLPIRLYQIGRKYRDEIRPRHGLLRSREFIMKDLYTFDYSLSQALATYQDVRTAYRRLFNELKIPYLVAEADSGNIGGNLSHEFHFPNSNGEDRIISCSGCSYVVNEERAEEIPPRNYQTEVSIDDIEVWRGISVDRTTLVNVWFTPPPSRSSHLGDLSVVSMRAVKAVFPDLDSTVEQVSKSLFMEHQPKDCGSTSVPTRILNLIDGHVPQSVIDRFLLAASDLAIWPDFLSEWNRPAEVETRTQDPGTDRLLNLLRIQSGDKCPRCDDGMLQIHRAIEIAHTFHLGTRYSEPLMADVEIPNTLMEDESNVGRKRLNSISRLNQQVMLQMGCHGIGVTRMIGAIADTLADQQGLNWPRVIAPYEVVIVPSRGLELAALEVYDTLHARTARKVNPDSVLDDRLQSFPWKMQDADLAGYPVIVVIGRGWEGGKMCEVQCRRLQIRQEVSLHDLTAFVAAILEQL